MVKLRNGRSRMFFKIGVLKNFANLTGKFLCWICFNKIAGLYHFKKRLPNRFFPMKFAKFLRIPIFTEHLRWLLLGGNKMNRN